MYGASNIPILAHPSALFMYMDPSLTPGDPSSEERDYPPIMLGEEEQAEIDRILENHAMIDSASSASSTATTPTVPQPSSISINHMLTEPYSSAMPSTTSTASASSPSEPFLPLPNLTYEQRLNIKVVRSSSWVIICTAFVSCVQIIIIVV